MSIKPIDLQTLFVKMNEVGREQSQIKEHASLQQDQAARSQITQELADENRVLETPDDEAAVGVKDDESRDSARKRQKRDQEEQKTEPAKKETLSDPKVGQHIDLTG